MSKKVGFIGCGNMGSAMIGGLIKSGFASKEDIIVSDKIEASLETLREKLGVNITLDNNTVIKESDVIFLAVKPFLYKDVIEEIKGVLSKDKIIITIAAGVSIKDIEQWLGDGFKVIRTMPNTPALVGEAMSAICINKNVSQEELEYTCNLYKSFGEYVELDEKDFDGFTALCGSSPAYVFIFIEAMADAAVKLGIPRAKAYRMASQSVLGSAKMVLDTGKHPGELKDMVCSPGGTTIEAVAELEKHGFRNAIIEAVVKCAEKSKSM